MNEAPVERLSEAQLVALQSLAHLRSKMPLRPSRVSPRLKSTRACLIYGVVSLSIVLNVCFDWFSVLYRARDTMLFLGAVSSTICLFAAYKMVVVVSSERQHWSSVKTRWTDIDRQLAQIEHRVLSGELDAVLGHRGDTLVVSIEKRDQADGQDQQ